MSARTKERGKIGQRKGKKEKKKKARRKRGMKEERGVSRKNDASVEDFIETYQEGNSRLNSRPVSCAVSNADVPWFFSFNYYFIAPLL